MSVIISEYIDGHAYLSIYISSNVLFVNKRKHTLGCPDTFEFRRQEVGMLTQIYGCYPSPSLEMNDIIPIDDLDKSISIEVTDDDVVNSFLYEISEKGSLFQYLQLSQVSSLVRSFILCSMFYFAI